MDGNGKDEEKSTLSICVGGVQWIYANGSLALHVILFGPHWEVATGTP